MCTHAKPAHVAALARVARAKWSGGPPVALSRAEVEAMRTSRWKLVAAFLLMETFGGGRIVLAGPDKPLVVLSAAVNRAAETLTLKGQNFGSTAPAVYCE